MDLIGGSKGRRWRPRSPQRDPILSFCMRCCQKVPTSEVGAPQWLVVPQREILDPPLDLERGIAAFPHNFRESRGDMKTVRQYASLKIWIQHQYSVICDSKIITTVIFQGPPFFNVGSSLGPLSIILDPLLNNFQLLQ